MEEEKTSAGTPGIVEIPSAVPWWRRGDFDRERIVVWALVLAGMLLRFWYLRDFSGSPLFDLALGADVGEYYRRARQLLVGDHFPVTPDIHAPVYSYFLALLLKIGRGNVPFVRTAQLVLNFGAWLALYWLLKTRRTPLKVRLWFLGIAMLLPVPVFYQAELVSESLLLPLAAAFLWLRYFSDFSRTMKRRAGALCGAGTVLAAMNLTHPITLLFSAAEVALELRRRKYHRAVLLFAVLLFFVGGYCAVQSIHYRELCGIQSNSGFNIYLGNNPDANGGCYLRPGRRWRKVHREAAVEAERSSLPVDTVFLKRAGRFWLQHPFKGLLLWGWKAVKVCSPRELASGSDLPPLVCFTRIVFYGRLLTPLLIIMAGYGLWRLLRSRRRIRCVHGMLLFFSLYLAQIVTVTSGRYRLLMLVPAALFAAYGVIEFNWRRLWYILPPAFVVCCFFTVTDYGKMRAEAAIIYAEAAFRNGDFRQVEELAAYAERDIDNPDPAHCAELRGGAAEKLAMAAAVERESAVSLRRREAAEELRREAQRRIDAAGIQYRRAVTLEPEYYRGWMHLARLAENAGICGQAGKWYRKALEYAPGAPDLRYNYAYFTFRQAEMWYRMALKLSPGDPGVCGSYALLCFRLRRAECAEAVRKAIDADPSWFRSWHLAGVVAMRLDGDLRLAVECFGRALELSPDAVTREINLNNLRSAEHKLSSSR